MLSSRPDAWLAVQSVHLPHYSHTAVLAGTVILLVIIVLEAVVTLSVLRYRRTDDSSPVEDSPSRRRPANTRQQMWS
jgi:hypothetical protein